MIKQLCAGFLAAALLGVPAHALDSLEAETVVRILERLVPERGERAHLDEDAAADWYEYDNDTGTKLIRAAGLTPARWAQAYNETLSGFAATLPDAEIAAIKSKAAHNLGASNLSAEQKQAIKTELDTLIAKLEADRKNGKRFESIVRPFAKRLRPLVLKD